MYSREEKLIDIVVREHPDGIVVSSDFYAIARRSGFRLDGPELPQILLECTISGTDVDMNRFLASRRPERARGGVASAPTAVEDAGRDAAGAVTGGTHDRDGGRGGDAPATDPQAAEPGSARAAVEHARSLERLHRNFVDRRIDRAGLLSGMADLGVNETEESRVLINRYITRSGLFSFGEFFEAVTTGTPVPPDPFADVRARQRESVAEERRRSEIRDRAVPSEPAATAGERASAREVPPHAWIDKDAAAGSISMAELICRTEPSGREVSRPMSPSFVHPNTAISLLESGEVSVADWARTADLIQRYRSGRASATDFFRDLESAEGIRRLDFASRFSAEGRRTSPFRTRPPSSGILPTEDRPVPFAEPTRNEIRAIAAARGSSATSRSVEGATAMATTTTTTTMTTTTSADGTVYTETVTEHETSSSQDAHRAASEYDRRMADANVKVLSPKEKPIPPSMRRHGGGEAGEYGGIALGFSQQAEVTHRAHVRSSSRRDHGNIVSWTGQPEQPRPRTARRDAGNVIAWTSAPTNAEEHAHFHKGHVRNHNRESTATPFNHRWGS